MFKKLNILFFLLFFLNINVMLVSADMEVYCPFCKEHIYNYKKDTIASNEIVAAEDFEGVGDILSPDDHDEMICPICGAPINGYEYWFWSRGYQPTRMVFPAVSLYFKNADGTFEWKPEEVDLEDYSDSCDKNSCK